MAETVLVNAIVSSASLNNATVARLSADDGSYATAANTNTDVEVRVGFASPSGNLSGQQTITARAKKQGGSGTPTGRLELYETGGATPLAQTGEIGLTSATVDTDVTLNFAASLLSDPSGASVEVRFFGTRSGGSPGARAAADVDSIIWTASTAAPNHALSPSGFATGAPELASPALAVVHALAAAALAAGTPTLDAPSLAQAHAFVPSAVDAAAPVLGTPALSSGDSEVELEPLAIDAGTPELGAPALVQQQALAAVGFDTPAPTLGSPALAAVHALQLSALTAGTPAIGSPVVAQVHALSLAGIATGAASLGALVLNPGPGGSGAAHAKRRCRRLRISPGLGLTLR